MLGAVFVKTLRDQRRAMIGWSVGVALLVLLEAALWPSIRDMPDLKEFLAGYPEAMRRLFNLQDFGTGTGFLNAELFSAVVPVLFIIFGIGRGAGAIAGEEESGTLDVLLVTPLSSTRLVVERAIALTAVTAILGGVLFVATWISSAIFSMGVDPIDLLGATVAMVLLGVEFGCLALAVGAITGRRSVAVGVASALAVAGYLLYLAGELVEAIGPWQRLSPFHQALDGGPLGAGLPGAYLWMPLIAVLAVATSAVIFDRRDITVH